jgi:hypothetical protein
MKQVMKPSHWMLMQIYASYHESDASVHVVFMCLVPTATTADSAAIARGDGTCNGGSFARGYGLFVKHADRRRVKCPTPVQASVVETVTGTAPIYTIRNEVVGRAVAIIERVAGAHFPPPTGGKWSATTTVVRSDVSAVQHGAVGASGLVSWAPVTHCRIRPPGPGIRSTRAPATIGGAACLHGDEGPAVRWVGAAHDVVGIVKAIGQDYTAIGQPRLAGWSELRPSELGRAVAGVAGRNAADAVGAGAAVLARVRVAVIGAVVASVGRCQRRNTGTGEGRGTVGAGAAVLAGAVPAVVVLGAAGAVSATGGAARLRGGDAGRVRSIWTPDKMIGVEGTGGAIHRHPVGVVLARWWRWQWWWWWLRCTQQLALKQYTQHIGKGGTGKRGTESALAPKPKNKLEKERHTERSRAHAKNKLELPRLRNSARQRAYRSGRRQQLFRECANRTIRCGKRRQQGLVLHTLVAFVL